ncbi:hypothetical protein BKP35_12125 [Anaerobacillus arseniciselenatis]|uniref:Uncharacterized protein n=1 Tax=Anaerobacillus arseniciselenatis TaxID=85682 RepID=A0A1S2LHD8_9BACI|nr:hypothetical protein [Anaerobacillus arseniciselenatis]OIJ11483.1 hypothetical protein BKP35_12125 [Anaerobacillus arseniciselenatis]
MDLLQRFEEAMTVHSLDIDTTYSKRMYLIEMMLYGSSEKVGDVDFSTFTVSELKKTIDDILEYESDEITDYDFEDARNIGNPIYELNSLAGLTNNILAVKPQQKKKRRFI